MRPKKTVFDACDPTRVKMLERSFNAAWSIICSRRVQVGSPREAELRSELARCIQKLAAKGFADSDELTKRCVEELLLGPRSSRRMTRSCGKSMLCKAILCARPQIYDLETGVVTYID